MSGVSGVKIGKKDKYGAELEVGDLVVYRAAEIIRLGRIDSLERQGSNYNIKIKPLEKRAQPIGRSRANVIKVAETTLTIAKLMGGGDVEFVDESGGVFRG